MRENGVATDKPLDNVILERLKCVRAPAARGCVLERACDWGSAAPPLTLRSTFATHNKLKKEAMKVIAAGMPADEIAGLRSIFKAIDADESGTITADELREALKQKGSLLKKVRQRPGLAARPRLASVAGHTR